MLKIQCDPITNLGELKDALQGAIELEHSTIPPYLTALYSLKQGASKDITEIIQSIVVEEMLHMTIASNVLIAIGGNPVINKPGFVPKYPGGLPLCVQEGLVVHLRKLSLPQVHDAFMQIEEPEDPIQFESLLAAAPKAPETIGEFYSSMQAAISRLGNEIFDPARQDQQVLSWFGRELFPIVGVNSANQAIEIIITQGEGTPNRPVDPEGELAHYYQFSEIYHQQRLVKDPVAPNGYSYSGAPLVFADGDIYPMIDDPATSKYQEGSYAEFLSNQFNHSYTKLLNALHITFNGNPQYIDQAIGLMFALKVQAIQLMQTPVDPNQPNGATAGPSFEYMPLNG